MFPSTTLQGQAGLPQELNGTGTNGVYFFFIRNTMLLIIAVNQNGDHQAEKLAQIFSQAAHHFINHNEHAMPIAHKEKLL